MAIIKTTPKTVGNTGNANRPVETTAVAKTTARTPAARTGASRVSQAAPKPSRDFLNDTMLELRKVQWPSKEDVRSGTIVTVMLLVAFGAYVYGLDSFFTWIFDALKLYGDSPAPVR